MATGEGNTYTSVDTWNGDERSWSAVAAVDDIHLRARQVELSALVRACGV